MLEKTSVFATASGPEQNAAARRFGASMALVRAHVIRQMATTCTGSRSLALQQSGCLRSFQCPSQTQNLPTSPVHVEAPATDHHQMKLRSCYRSASSRFHDTTAECFLLLGKIRATVKLLQLHCGPFQSIVALTRSSDQQHSSRSMKISVFTAQ